MSILDALRVQKANQQSVSQLAALPQNEIIRLAQVGHIPADVVPVIISEKARMAKEMANLQAAAQTQGRQMPTVIEQAMQANAQAEMPQPPPQQAPMQPPEQPPAQPQAAPQGVAGLPTGQMFQGQNFEAGGIVAFNGEEDSFVEGPTGLKQLRSEVEPPKPGAGPASLAEFIKQFQGMTAASRRPSAEEIAYQEALKKGALSPKDVEQQKYMRLLQAGLGIMGGTSPYGLANIGQGAQEALKGYGEDVRSQQAQRLAELKAAAESSRAQRAESMQDIQGGAQLYGQYLDRELRRELAKDSQLGAKYAENYLAMKRSEGDKRPDDVIRNEGYNEFFRRYGFAEQRAAIAAGTAQAGQRVQLAGIEERYVNQAQDSVDKTLGSFASAESREYRKLQREDPTGKKASEFRQKLVNDRARELQSAAQVISPGQTAAPQGGQPTAPSAPAKPDISKVQGAPRGATVGKLVDGKGWEVLGSDGKLVGYLQP